MAKKEEHVQCLTCGQVCGSLGGYRNHAISLHKLQRSEQEFEYTSLPVTPANRRRAKKDFDKHKVKEEPGVSVASSVSPQVLVSANQHLYVPVWMKIPLQPGQPTSLITQLEMEREVKQS